MPAGNPDGLFLYLTFPVFYMSYMPYLSVIYRKTPTDDLKLET